MNKDLSGVIKKTKKSKSLDGDVQPTIDLGEMLKELTSIVEWRTLLLNLGMDKYKIDEIEEDYDKIEHRKQEGLDRWLRNKHDACWNDIIKALFEMGQDTLARALEEKYTWKDSMGTSSNSPATKVPVVSRSRSVDSKPERTLKLGEMLNELRSIVEWRTLLLRLGMKNYEINKIEADHQKVEHRKQQGLDRWLRNKHDACWSDIIKALFEMGEGTLARALAKKYTWKDPRVKVDTVSLVNAPGHVCITAIPIPLDLPYRKFLPSLQPNQEYFTLKADPPNIRITTEATKHFYRWIKEKPRQGHTLYDFLRSIEESEYKSDFKIGLKARFGKMYWNLNPEDILPVKSPREKWSESKVLRKAAFCPEITENDVEQFFMNKEKLGRKVFTSITLKFNVEGQGEGDYSAVIASYDEDEMFYLDSVYRQTVTEKRVRINFALPGSKYDVRIADCSECIVLEDQDSTPYQIASMIVTSLCRLPIGKLRLILHGSIQSGQALSHWKVQYLRQRKQIQHKWRHNKRWVVARYDINEFDSQMNTTVDVDNAPLNEAVDIPEFDCARKEVELLGQQVFPKDVHKTHPSKEKYFYIEGIDGVKLPGGEERSPYHWTAADLMSDFEEFLGDAFKLAYNLGGTVY